MKKNITALAAIVPFMCVFTMGLFAQEKTELSVQVKKDGKVLKDTTYQFEDEDDAIQAVKMMEILSGEDGEKTEIKEFNGDSLVWVSEGEHEGKHTHGEYVVIMKSGNGETLDVLLDENQDGDENVIVIKKSPGEEDEKEAEIEVIEKVEKEEKKNK